MIGENSWQEWPIPAWLLIGILAFIVVGLSYLAVSF